MEVKYEHGYTGITHIYDKGPLKTTILFLLCGRNDSNKIIKGPNH